MFVASRCYEEVDSFSIANTTVFMQMRSDLRHIHRIRFYQNSKYTMESKTKNFLRFIKYVLLRMLFESFSNLDYIYLLK